MGQRDAPATASRSTHWSEGGAASECWVIARPPDRHIYGSAVEHPPRAIVVIAVQHGPIHDLIVFLAFNLRGIGSLYLRPGALCDRLVVGDRLFSAEAFHFIGNAPHHFDHHILQRSLSFPIK